MFSTLRCASRLYSRAGKQVMSTERNLTLSKEIGRIIRAAPAFCFDVDSTVITKEGIDELAAFKKIGTEVTEVTKQAMNGVILFEDALTARLDIIKPSREEVSEFVSQHPFELTPGIQELINTLHSQGKFVYLVSGGFRQIIEPVADRLRIPYHRIFANSLMFHESTGEYAGFDGNEPTSKDGGKSAVVQSLIDAHGYNPIVIVGDGVTDLQARPPAKVFIGFGGIVERERVKAESDWFIKDFEELLEILKSPSY